MDSLWRLVNRGPSRPEDYADRKPTIPAGSWTSEHGQIIEMRFGDITQEDTICIVNAANGRLSHGSGVAGEIRKKGGPLIVTESDRIMANNQLRTGTDMGNPTV
eukprot:TRINITY_DN16323_c0_g1_i1.p1 TRINITY_DN16323_c0_g1~~TRINITY_DN16323_c0_g1_i1.p1  ORF type:complete len:104 (-),score=11.62 TRINITY_DN16323_c0_g1_i1:92-403(-)